MKLLKSSITPAKKPQQQQFNRLIFCTKWKKKRTRAITTTIKYNICKDQRTLERFLLFHTHIWIQLSQYCVRNIHALHILYISCMLLYYTIYVFSVHCKPSAYRTVFYMPHIKWEFVLVMGARLYAICIYTHLFFSIVLQKFVFTIYYFFFFHWFSKIIFRTVLLTRTAIAEEATNIHI